MPTPSEIVQSMSVESAIETTPLLQRPSGEDAATASVADAPTARQELFNFLEAKTPKGRIYEAFIIGLIILNVIAFILSTLFVEKYNDDPWANHTTGICQKLCDALWFGNYKDNGLDDLLNLGATSILELFTVAVFTVEYILRLYTADLEMTSYQGFWGRLRFLPTFFSLVDLASILPFYVDAFFLRQTDLASSSFLRMFRLFRMIRAEGRYDTALTMVDDVYRRQKGILLTALFVGVTTWITVSALYYLTERRNLDMIYCATCGDVETSLCSIGAWGMANCTFAGCPGTSDNPQPCYNMYESIPMASYYALLNLFGEFPLMLQHSYAGKIVGTVVSVVAVAVFALPVGIIGNGFEDVIEERRAKADEPAPIVEEGGMTPGFHPGDSTTIRARLYNLLHAIHATDSADGTPVTRTAMKFDIFINVLVVATALTFMIDTTAGVTPEVRLWLDCFEVLSVSIFTVEYILRVYSAKEDPKYQGGMWSYVTSFLPIVDLLSFLPFWLEVAYTGKLITPSAYSSTWSNVVKSLRLLRILRFERYTHAFLSFDDVFRRNMDILAVTAFTALLFWVFFAAFLYLSERNSPDAEMAANYKSVPDSMWMTLLNLSGESPLSQYSAAGKVVTGILGLFATG
jgi:heme/copper-type cytochrome/quinol oxidase subunit 4